MSWVSGSSCWLNCGRGCPLVLVGLLVFSLGLTPSPCIKCTTSLAGSCSFPVIGIESCNFCWDLTFLSLNPFWLACFSLFCYSPVSMKLDCILFLSMFHSCCFCSPGFLDSPFILSPFRVSFYAAF